MKFLPGGVVMLVVLAIGSLDADARWRGIYFGSSRVISADLEFATTGTIQQTVTNFRGGLSRGTIRSSLVASSNDSLTVSARDVLDINGRRFTLKTTFTSPCGCAGSGRTRLNGRATVRARSISYSAKNASGRYEVRGSLRTTPNGLLRKETRRIKDPDFDVWDTFTFTSRLFLANRR